MRTLVLLITFCFVAVITPAQVITGSILGTVTDPTGAVVPGAEITITEQETNVVTRTTTNAAGEFTMPYLRPGVYKVTIEATGFNTYTESGIQLRVDSKYRANATLSVGPVSEAVEVVAQVQSLQTDSSDLNSTVSQRAIEALPNIGRNPLSYVSIVAGIVPREGFEDPDNIGIGENSRKQFSNFTVNGSRPVSSEILLDGAPNTSGAFNEVAVMPNIDAIGDLKVITNAYSAEYGRAGGGVVSFNTKSGTNALHGSLYEYWRNPVLNANSFGNNSYGTNPDGSPARPKGKFNINQFGGSVSGPVVLPNKYDGRDKTFFFFSYEGLRRVADASDTFTVPTELERKGDFSETLVQVRNPATGQLEVWNANVYMPFASTTNVIQINPGTYRLEREQFPGNRIPSSYLNPTSLKLVNYFPLPNIVPTNPDGTGNYFDSNSVRTRTDQIILKLDQNFSQQHRSFFRFTTDWTRNDPANRFQAGNPEAGNDAPTTQFNPSVTIGHTWARSPQDLFEFRANMTRINLILQPSSGLNADLEGLGFSSEELNVAPSRAFPRVVISGYQQMGLGNFALRDNHTTNFAFTGSYTKILNKWTLKFGGEYRPLYNNFFQAMVTSFAFSNMNLTNSCTGPGCPTLPYNSPQGRPLADFLIGSMDGAIGSGQFTTGDPRLALRNIYFGFYSQNDWKATRNLTINLGIRWEYQGPLTERYDRLSQFHFSALNATGTPGIYVFPGVGGNGRGQFMPDYRNWAPRIGFAWRALPQTVIRAAYGITYDMTTGVGSGANGFGTDGFKYPAFISPRPESGLDILDRPYNDAFSGGGTIIGPNSNDPRYLGAATAFAIERNQRNPYVQQWNFTIERELPAGVMASASYVGTKGTRLIIQQWDVNGDNGIPESILTEARDTWIRTGVNPLSSMVPNPFYGIVPPGNPNVSAQTIRLSQLHKRFPAYSNVRIVGQRFGSSIYHGLQLNVRRAFRHGVEVGANYTFSKSIDFGNSISVNSGNTSNGGGASNFTQTDLSIERSVANSDIPQRLVFHWLAQTPYAGTNRFVRQTLGGWKVGGIAAFSAGLPLSITGGGFGRPDLVGDPILPQEYRCFGDGVTPCALPDGSSIVVPNRRMLYFNPKAYQLRVVSITNTRGQQQWQNDLYWYGTAPRFDSRLRGVGINNFNLSIGRQFRFTERAALEFRLEMVNAFNRTEFADSAIDRTFGNTNLNPANGAIDGTSTDTAFGTIDITRLKRTPRYMQMSLRLTF